MGGSSVWFDVIVGVGGWGWGRGGTMGLKRGLGLKKQPNCNWSPKELALLKRRYAAKNTSQVAAILGKSCLSVSMKAHKLGLSKEYIRRWSPEEVKLVKKYFATEGACRTAARLNRPYYAVMQKARLLGLTKKRKRR